MKSLVAVLAFLAAAPAWAENRVYCEIPTKQPGTLIVVAYGSQFEGGSFTLGVGQGTAFNVAIDSSSPIVFAAAEGQSIPLSCAKGSSSNTDDLAFFNFQNGIGVTNVTRLAKAGQVKTLNAGGSLVAQVSILSD